MYQITKQQLVKIYLYQKNMLGTYSSKEKVTINATLIFHPNRRQDLTITTTNMTIIYYKIYSSANSIFLPLIRDRILLMNHRETPSMRLTVHFIQQQTPLSDFRILLYPLQLKNNHPIPRLLRIIWNQRLSSLHLGNPQLFLHLWNHRYFLNRH